MKWLMKLYDLLNLQSFNTPDVVGYFPYSNKWGGFNANPRIQSTRDKENVWAHSLIDLLRSIYLVWIDNAVKLVCQFDIIDTIVRNAETHFCHSPHHPHQCHYLFHVLAFKTGFSLLLVPQYRNQKHTSKLNQDYLKAICCIYPWRGQSNTYL